MQKYLSLIRSNFYIFVYLIYFNWNIITLVSITSLIALTVKCLPTVCETRIQTLGREDPLEKEMATHSNILAWKIPWAEESGRLQSMESKRVGHDWATSLSLFTFILKDGLKKILLLFMSNSILPLFFSKSFTISDLIFRSLTHVKLIFVYGVRLLIWDIFPF